MKFKLEPMYRNIPDDDLISDLIRIKDQLNKQTVTQREYAEHGKYSTKPFFKRFGSWNKALEKAGLALSHKKYVSKDDLFKNMEDVWIKLGRQPRYAEFKKPLSRYSGATYTKRFGGWGKEMHLTFKKEEYT